MSVILCDRCGDGVYLTAEFVSLPYVCQACEEAAEIREAAKPATPAKNKRGKFSGVNVQTATEVCDKIFGKQAGQSEPEPQQDCGCGTATVEATTELIEDLNRQLAAEKSLASVLLKSAEVLAEDNAEYKSLLEGTREDFARISRELEAERSSATRAQLDITLLEGRLVKAKYELQEESESSDKIFSSFTRLVKERDDLKGVIADHKEMVQRLYDDLNHSRDERSLIRADKRFYRELAIERADHPFSNLWKWFKRLF